MTIPPQRPGQFPEREPPREPAKSRIGPRLIAEAVLLVLLVIFLAENTRSVKMRLIVPEVRAPLFLALLIAGVLGALAVMIARRQRRRRSAR
jgi:uncharacterized integral membrane protein